MNAIEFCRWESDCFGFGYGTGEEHTLAAVKRFLSVVPSGGVYEYEKIELLCGSSETWLLINIFCRSQNDSRMAKDSVISYGSSPRYGFLTDFGREVKAFVDSKTIRELILIVNQYQPGDDPIYQEEVKK